MKKFLLFSMLAFAFMACEEEDIETANRVSFESGVIAVEVPRDAVDFERIITVYTTTTSSSDRTFDIIVDTETATLDDADYSIPTSVTVPANSAVGEFTLTVSDLSLNFEAQILSISLVSSDGTFGGIADLEVTELCVDTIVELAITLDDYPDETTWDLYDLSVSPAVIIFSGGPFINPDDIGAVKKVEFCLASGEYGIAVNDAYGDGIVNGGFEINEGATTLASGAVTGSGGSASFTIE
ncbi:hypothetical protein [Winogradskyella wichelsiae]|uniref:hypothetical protein n=1 Tax=Winogradskyella wichelsiae TaxID=2697007 RepID=UPI003EF582ED